ncbi:sulfate/molybdate ABC transporter ATP-binding protein [Gluconacetobacter azotocaptans]|uniref:Sulfate/molybdate ABC transporter ATP-binding protein n=1 Tax=Gluconacetobacter azotocaptans TaxID=142834 RepID=A0A7W4JTG7_9PROT|nr:sulfate/molybdate ABC transporter ATP-binding protein [Gluconacetobacter azotocaptans]MBB2190623.1 sulfate/molybdate ABC transporter ATP-binding protein [Gluconacetobacter azotocaptans]MBM9402885.1 sulfate/molybdate ABC transporter ATP-binding protein [Gluconacetobacter azotocaptans]GBQ32673.1 nitrate/sulfonate/bicarbonate transporter ATP-binding protein [Gluconacetobacter azotocaptans DSM 13594]
MSLHVTDIVRHVAGRARPILDGVSLDIADSEFVALVGPSGAGKSSLLRVVAGLDFHQGGAISLDGTPMEGRPARERHIGFVFQNYALFPHMTVAGNIAFGLRILPRRQRPARAEIARRVAELLELMHLPGMEGAYPAQLSGGQRQRVALARALATQPRLLLLDEPFGALDPMVRKSIRTWLRGVHDRLGLTTILVTHDQHEAMDIADRLVVMQDGRIVQTAPAPVLERDPATPFVMQFLGECLAFEGVVRRGRMVPDDGDVLPFPAEAPDGRATAMIRPYDAVLRPGMGQARAALDHTRGGYAHLDIAIGERHVTIMRPADESEYGPQARYGLDISAARLFRDGRSLFHGLAACDTDAGASRVA